MSKTTVSAAGVSAMTSAILTATSRVAVGEASDGWTGPAPLLRFDSMMGPSCGMNMYVQYERTPPTWPNYTRTLRHRNGALRHLDPPGDGVPIRVGPAGFEPATLGL